VTPRRECPICGAREAAVLHHQPFVLPAGHPLGSGYDVVACATCGFVYADTGVSQRQYDRYYAELSKYEDPATSTGGGEQPWDDDRLASTAATIARHLPRPDAEIADLGCANGGLLRHLASAGYRRLWGVDPSPQCAAAAGTVPGCTGLTGSLFALPPELTGADAVVLSHVLEHLIDVRGGLAAAVRLLRPGGVIYVEVPDATRYADCLAAPFQDFNTEHLNHFGPVSLRGLLQRAGLEVVTVERKTIAAAAAVPYPAVFGVGRRLTGSASLASPMATAARDDELAPALGEYVRLSAALLARIEQGLAPLVERGKPIFVWGVGQLTLKLLAMTRLRDLPIRAFLDSSPRFHGTTLAGAPVRPPEAAGEADLPVLVGTLLHGEAIERQIRAMGLSNQVLRLESLIGSVEAPVS
jgi:Methyltransferase domain